jgi:hypothetical protein
MEIPDTKKLFADLDTRVARLEKALPPKAISVFAVPCQKCGSEMQPPVTTWKSPFGPDTSWRDGLVLLLALLVFVMLFIVRSPFLWWSNGSSAGNPPEESPKQKPPWRCTKCGYECNR